MERTRAEPSHELGKGSTSRGQATDRPPKNSIGFVSMKDFTSRKERVKEDFFTGLKIF